jgi:hypothetical protein
MPKMYKPSQIVHIRGYNAENPIIGLAPLETLRRVLAEEHAAGEYRENFWKGSARMQGVIERPEKAPMWSDGARQRFREEWTEMYSGAENSGKTAILEEGMTWKQGGFNAQESEYLLGRKLTREECAREYHIPPPLVGILDHATFSNIKEQHKHLYQDCLGPWLAMIEDDVALQLLTEFESERDVLDQVYYCEFNIAEKLKGSFEEQTTAVSTAVGRPWMTANEGRALFNMPSMDGDADQLVTPLNVLVGGQASPRDVDPTGSSGRVPVLDTKALDLHNQELRERHEEKWRAALVRHYKRQEAAIVSRVPEKAAKVDIGGVWWDDDRWDRELYEDLLPLNVLTATEWAELAARALEAEVDVERMQAWLREHSRVQAAYINGYTRDQLAIALRDPEPREAVKGVFEAALTVWAVREAMSAVTTAQSFGAVEGAAAGGMQYKTWQVNSSNPRTDHAALNGTTVGIRDRFPNGLRWPGDPRGDAAQNANCQCTVRFS